MADPLSASDLAVFARQLQAGAPLGAPAPEEERRPYKHYVPLVAAADEYEAWAKDRESRVYTGIAELDAAMRGTAPGEMTELIGFSHSGKTVVGTEIIQNNPQTPFVLFTPDETRSLVLVKMVSRIHGIDAETLEKRLAANDAEARRLLRETATKHLPKLAVSEDALSLHEMSLFLREYEEANGEKPKAIMFDYLDLLQGAGEDVPSKASAIKAWGKRESVALFVLHQSSRSAGKDGAKVTLTSGGYGGEQQATHLIGVRRKKSEIIAALEEIAERLAGNPKDPAGLYQKQDELQYLLNIHQWTITVNLVKNKRPPCHLVDDLDYELDARTGRMYPLRHGDRPQQMRTASDARAARQALMEQREMEL